MNDLVNHNDLLEDIVAANNIQLLQRLVECTLNASTILKVMRKTKNYTVLSLLESFLSWNALATFRKINIALL